MISYLAFAVFTTCMYIYTRVFELLLFIMDFFTAECDRLHRTLQGKNYPQAPDGCTHEDNLENRVNRISAVAVERICDVHPHMRFFLETTLAFSGMYNVGMRSGGACDACGLHGEKLRLVRFVSCEAHPHLPAREFAVRTDVLQMARWLHFYKHISNWLTLEIADDSTFDDRARRVFDFVEARVSTLTI